MQITNNYTTVELNEELILAMIIDKEIGVLEKIIAGYYNTSFAKVPKVAFETQLYLCIVELNKTSAQLAEIYDLPPFEIRKIAKKCFDKMNSIESYRKYLYNFHFQFQKYRANELYRKNVA